MNNNTEWVVMPDGQLVTREEYLDYIRSLRD